MATDCTAGSVVARSSELRSGTFELVGEQLSNSRVKTVHASRQEANLRLLGNSAIPQHATIHPSAP